MARAPLPADRRRAGVRRPARRRDPRRRRRRGRWVIPPDRVQVLAAALSALTEAELRARFSPAKLAANDIYPDIWDEPEDDLWDEVWGYFEALRDAYARAAAGGHGLRIDVG